MRTGTNFGEYGDVRLNGFCLDGIVGVHQQMQGLPSAAPKGTICRNIDASSASASSRWGLTHTTIVVNIPVLSGKDKQLSLSVSGQEPFDCGGGQLSCSEMLQIHTRLPTIESISHVDEAETTGGYEMIVRGTDFGPSWLKIQMKFDTSSASSIAQRTCAVTEHSHTEIKCTVPPGEGGNLPVVVSVDGQDTVQYNGGPSNTFTYASPFVEQIVPPIDLPTSGMTSPQKPLIMSVVGRNFGTPSALVRSMNFGNTIAHDLHNSSNIVVEASHTKLSFVLSEGQGFNLKTTLSLSGLTSETKLVSYSDPRIDSISFEDGRVGQTHLVPTTGCYSYAIALKAGEDERECIKRASFDINGENFGAEPPIVEFQDQGSGLVKECYHRGDGASIARNGTTITFQSMTKSDCELIGWNTNDPTKHQHLKVVLPEGHGNILVRVIVASNRYSNYKNISYSSPFISQVNWGPTIDFAPFMNTIDGIGSVESENRLFIFGDNFGLAQTSNMVNVSIGDYDCDDVILHESSRTSKPKGTQFVSCAPPPLPVGLAALKITIALQTIVVDTDGAQIAYPRARWNDPLLVRCFEGFYGRDTEYCTPCWSFTGRENQQYAAAACTGKYLPGKNGQGGGSEEPLAQAGFAILPPLECQAQGSVCVPEFKKVYVPVGCDLDVQAGKGVRGTDRIGTPVADKCKRANEPGEFCHPHRLNGSIPLLSYEGAPNAAVVWSLRARCPHLMPCQPRTSCESNNTCAFGYVSYYDRLPSYPSGCPRNSHLLPDGRCFAPRCGECNPRTHFRLDGICELCPQNPLLLFLMICAVGIAGCICLYMLTAMQVNIAIFTIGVDYMQILSLLRKSKVAWPDDLLFLLKYFHWFNFDIDTTGPECAARELFTFTNKWWLKAFLPVIGIIIAFGAIGMVKGIMWFRHTFIKKETEKQKNKRKEKEIPIGSLLKSIFVTIIYFLYLVFCKSAIDVFNCTDTDPPTGKTYLRVLPLEECWIEGGVQAGLVVPASIFGLLYCFGFPGGVYYLFQKNKDVIAKDQTLRAYGKGDSKSNNPNFAFRKAYSKLYLNFKPSHYWWIEMQIGRKLALIAISMIFQFNPAFQLAVALLLMFACFGVQVKNQPYLGFFEKGNMIKEEAEKKILAGLARVDALESMALGGFMGADAITSSTIQDRIHSIRTKIVSIRVEAEKQRKLVRDQEMWLFNYNVIEEFYLICAIIVNLAGIMFDSSYLEGERNKIQKKILAYIIIVIILASLVFFCVVLGFEIYTAKNHIQAINKMRWIKASMVAHRIRTTLKHQKDSVKSNYALASVELRTAFNAIFNHFEHHTGALSKEDFAELLKVLADHATAAQKRENPAAGNPMGTLLPGWIEQADEKTGHKYYTHSETNETTWTRPVERANDVVISDECVQTCLKLFDSFGHSEGGDAGGDDAVFGHEGDGKIERDEFLGVLLSVTSLQKKEERLAWARQSEAHGIVSKIIWPLYRELQTTCTLIRMIFTQFDSKRGDALNALDVFKMVSGVSPEANISPAESEAVLTVLDNDHDGLVQETELVTFIVDWLYMSKRENEQFTKTSPVHGKMVIFLGTMEHLINDMLVGKMSSMFSSLPDAGALRPTKTQKNTNYKYRAAFVSLTKKAAMMDHAHNLHETHHRSRDALRKNVHERKRRSSIKLNKRILRRSSDSHKKKHGTKIVPKPVGQSESTASPPPSSNPEGEVVDYMAFVDGLDFDDSDVNREDVAVKIREQEEAEQKKMALNAQNLKLVAYGKEYLCEAAKKFGDDKVQKLVAFMKNDDGKTLIPSKIIKVFGRMKMKKPRAVVSAMLSLQGTPITPKQFLAWCNPACITSVMVAEKKSEEPSTVAGENQNYLELF